MHNLSPKNEEIKLISRDHNLLFHFENSTNNIHNVHRIQNRIVYRNIRLKITLEKNKCPCGTFLHEAIVDWYNCHISAFFTEDDKINNIPCYVGYFSIPLIIHPITTNIDSTSTSSTIDMCSKLTLNDDGTLFKQLLVECFQFLKRGHSLFHMGCRCDRRQQVLFSDHNHSSFQKKRYVDLGFNNIYQQTSRSIMTLPPSCCKVQSDRRMQSLDAIAKELGIINIYTGYINICLGTTPLPPPKNEKKTMVRMKLLHALLRYGNFTQYQEGNNTFLSSNICCIPRTISCVQDIIQAIKIMDPEPFRWILSQGSFNGVGGGGDTSNKNLTAEYLMQDQILSQLDQYKARTIFRTVEEYDERDRPTTVSHPLKKKRKIGEENKGKKCRPISITFYSMNKSMDIKQQQVDDDIRYQWKAVNISKFIHKIIH